MYVPLEETYFGFVHSRFFVPIHGSPFKRITKMYLGMERANLGAQFLDYETLRQQELFVLLSRHWFILHSNKSFVLRVPASRVTKRYLSFPESRLDRKNVNQNGFFYRSSLHAIRNRLRIRCWFVSDIGLQ